MEWLELILPLVTGVALGTLYFGGLWLTVQKVSSTAYPGLLMIGSFFMRIGILLITFYWLIMSSWTFLAVGLVGFLLARTALIHRLKPQKEIPAGENYGI